MTNPNGTPLTPGQKAAQTRRARQAAGLPPVNPRSARRNGGNPVGTAPRAPRPTAPPPPRPRATWTPPPPPPPPPPPRPAAAPLWPVIDARGLVLEGLAKMEAGLAEYQEIRKRTNPMSADAKADADAKFRRYTAAKALALRPGTKAEGETALGFAAAALATLVNAVLRS